MDVTGLKSPLEVQVTKITTNGHIFVEPLQKDEGEYLTHLARLNNYYSDKKTKVVPITSFPGHKQIFAVKSKAGRNENELWYRGRIIAGFKSCGGLLAKVILVDEGDILHVPFGKSICRLEEEFCKFPFQQMECILHGVTPLNYVTCSKKLIRRGESWTWDSAATILLTKCAQGKTGSIIIHDVDQDGCYHISLSITANEGEAIDVSRLLVSKGFATIKRTEEDEGLTGSDTNVEYYNANITSHQNASSYEESQDHLKTDAFESAAIEDYSWQTHGRASDSKAECERLQQKRLQLFTEDIFKTVDNAEEPKEGSYEISVLKKREIERQKDDKNQIVKERVLKNDGGFTSEPPRSTTDDDSSSRQLPLSCAPMPASFFQKKDKGVEVLPKKARLRSEPRAPAISDDDYEAFKAKIRDKTLKKRLSSQSSEDGSDRCALLNGAELLRVLTKHAKEGKALYEKADRKDWQELEDVLTVGKGVEPATCIQRLHIPKPMLLVLGEDLLQKATPLQAQMWPSVLRGRDVVGIGPKNSGKTIASLIPIFTQVVETQDSYSDIPATFGPLVLILAPSWRKVEELVKLCRSILHPYRRLARVLGIYGGQGDVKDQSVSLLNGCEILVSTPPILNKMLSKLHTDFERLCHVVFDQADVIADLFTEDVRKLMRCYADAIRRANRTVSTRQFVANACEWTKGIDSMVNAYFQSPFIVVSDGMEKAAFSKVAHVVESCVDDEKLQYLSEHLEDRAGENIIVFVESAQTAEKLTKHLERLGFPALLATEFLSPLELKDSMMAWNASRNSGIAQYTLVATDATNLTIRNATCVIHYDFPASKTALSKRLDTMLENMKAKIKGGTSTQLSSCFLVSDAALGKMPGLVRYLKRCGQTVPESIARLAEEAQQLKELSKNEGSLCESLKLFGYCRERYRCSERHTIFPNVDGQVRVPTCGVIKVIILDVLSASHFMARIVEYRPPPTKAGHPEFNSGISMQLSMDMQFWFSKDCNRIRTPSFAVNDVYAVKTEDGYSRVRVLYVFEKDAETGIPRKVKTIGIDSALEHTPMVEELLTLPEHFRSIPGQAVELIVCGVRPEEGSSDWTTKACFTMEKLVIGQTLEGRIALSCGNTIWVDPLVEKLELENIKAVTVSLNVASHLIKSGFGVRNPEHSKNLRALLKAILPDLEDETNQNLEEAVTEEIPMEIAEFPSEEFHDVYVSAVISPDLMFLHLVQNLERLEKFEEKLHAVMSVLERRDPEDGQEKNKTEPLSVGAFCVAKYPEDKRWYRGLITAHVSEGSEVFFFDHGDDDIVPFHDIAPAWPEILGLPKQALPCKLVNVKPIGEQWSSESCDALWKEVEGKLLQAKVVYKEPLLDPEGLLHGIELYDATQESTVNISQEFVLSGHAQASEKLIQSMFPEAISYPTDIDSEDEYQRIPFLCLQIYKSKDQSKLALAKELQAIVDRSERHSDQIRENGGVRCLCQVLALVSELDVREVLLHALVRVCQGNPRNIDELRVTRGLKTICDMLQEESCSEFLSCVVRTLSEVSTIQSNKNAVRMFAGVNGLCQTLARTNSNELKSEVLRCLGVLCQENDQNCVTVRNVQGIQAICSVLEDDEAQECWEDCLKTLKSISLNVKNRDELRKANCIQSIFRILKDHPSERLLLCSIAVLKHLGANNSINTDLMRNVGIEDLLRKILSNPKRSYLLIRKRAEEVLNLIDSAVSPFKEKSQVQLQRISSDVPKTIEFEDYQGCCSHPLTRWSQQKKTITLCIKVFNVQKTQVLLSEHRMVFRALTDEEFYELDLEFFGSILTEEWVEKSSGGDVLVIVEKKEKSIWPRLLASEFKVPYLSIDFDRWADEFSSSDEEGEPTNPDVKSLSSRLADLAVGDGFSGYESDDPSESDCNSDFDEIYFDKGSLVDNFLS